VKEQKPPPDLKRPWNAIALRASLVEVRLRDLQHAARPCENVRLWHLRPPRFVECQLRADIVEKIFFDDERKSLEPLTRFTRGDVREHIVSSQIDHRPP